MTQSHEDLLLDSDGIPILTDPLRDNEAITTTDDEAIAITDDEIYISGENVADVATLLLCSDSFMQQLDDIAEELTCTIREQLEQAIQPAIESAVSSALNESTTASTATIHEQLKNKLPEIIARTLHNELSQ